MGMDPSSALHQQEMGTHQTLESMLVCPKTQQLEEKKPRPQPTEAAAALKCPRCESNNTKFCYYNNYSLSQPRYFCKSCKRYWTQGGTLRNVPVGGGCRKTKRPSPSSSSSSASAIRSHDQPITATNPNPLSPLFPASTHDYYSSSDILSLAFAGLHNQSGTHHHYPNGFQNLYYGVGNGNLGSVENVGEETKQEIWNGRGEAESRGLWGIPIPWGINGSSGEGNYIGGDLDSSGRESWNGIGSNSSSNWHGLVNSTLM